MGLIQVGLYSNIKLKMNLISKQGYARKGIHDSFSMQTGFVLRFNGPVITIKVMSSRSVNLSTLSLDRLPKRLICTTCPYFCQLLTTALFESA